MFWKFKRNFEEKNIDMETFYFKLNLLPDEVTANFSVSYLQRISIIPQLYLLFENSFSQTFSIYFEILNFVGYLAPNALTISMVHNNRPYITLGKITCHFPLIKLTVMTFSRDVRFEKSAWQFNVSFCLQVVSLALFRECITRIYTPRNIASIKG